MGTAVNVLVGFTLLAFAGVSEGGTYIRWGVTTCPTRRGATLVYYGHAASSGHGVPGSGGERICLPMSIRPQWLPYQSGVQSNRASVYGAKYYKPFPEHPALDGARVPCAVCYTKYSTVLVIPARVSCPTRAWKFQYNGYLMASSSREHRSSFDCVDKARMHYGTTTAYGARFTYVQLMTGVLPENYYPESFKGRELSCVVCVR